jgi:hypothetical protein
MTTAAAPTAVVLPPGAAGWVRIDRYRCDVAPPTRRSRSAWACRAALAA